MLRGPGHFQDIDLLGNKFYFHPTGGEGLYEHDLTTKITPYLFLYGGGDHIAADSVFVFCDYHHTSIVRFNLLTDTTDLRIPFSFNANLLGLETYQGFLYAIVDGFPNQLRKYTYDGALIDSMVVPGIAFHLTINNGILYTTDYVTTIRRIDLITMNVLPSARKPARNLEGIRILDGRFYFCDWHKGIVGSIPLQDLN